MEEQELALRCARKDKAAQRELYEEYRSRILALCRRYAENPADAEDLMQDAFIKIFRVIGNFRWTRPGSLYSWMSRVSINLAFDTTRRRRRLAEQLVDVANLQEDLPEEPAYDESASVPSDVLDAMIESLPEGYRTVFRLYCIDGLSHREIADLLGIKEKSSSASLSRARAMLAEAVRQYWRDLDDGSSPEEWTQIQRKMRREEAARNIKIILALLIPVTSLLLWLQPRQSHDSISPYIAKTIAAENPSVIIPNTLQSPRGLMNSRAVIEINLADIPDDISETQEVFSGISDVNPDATDGDTEIQANISDIPLEKDDFPDFSEDVRKSRKKISISLRAGSGSNLRRSRISLNSSPYIAALTFMNTLDPSSIPDAKSNYSNTVQWYAAHQGNEFTGVAQHPSNHYRHDLPVTFGLNAHVDLTARSGVECGIEYTYIHSSVGGESEQLLSQALHFIGIPVRFDTQLLSWRGFDLYAGVGVKAEKCISASLGQVRCEEKRLQWSAGTFAGIQYRIGKQSHLYFQPDLSYYLTKTDLITYRTENPLTFSLNAGIRFDL